MNAALTDKADRVRRHTRENTLENLDGQNRENIQTYGANRTTIEARLAKLDCEWDVERTLEANAATLALTGAALGTTGNKKWFWLTGGVLGSIVMAIVSDVIPVTRRGAATGIIMTAFSMAAIGGVPAGVVLGAHFGWSVPFMLLVVLSAAIWFAGTRVVPPLAEHVGHRTPLSRIVPQLWQLLTLPRHLKAFALTFTMMAGHMLVIPFIAPMLVANHGIAPEQLSWLYMAGGAATFLTSRAVGRLADRYGKRQVFRAMALVSLVPVLFVTHLPARRWGCGLGALLEHTVDQARLARRLGLSALDDRLRPLRSELLERRLDDRLEVPLLLLEQLCDH